MVWSCKQNAQERLPKQALLAKVKGKRPVGRYRTRWEDYIEDLVVADRDVWRLNLMCGGSILSCCPRNLHGHERALKEEEELQ